MEVFIKDEDNVLSETDGVITTLIIPTEKVEIKSIDQHDLEIRADERKKVVTEFICFLEILITGAPFMNIVTKDYIMDNMRSRYCEELEQKPTKLKGE